VENYGYFSLHWRLRLAHAQCTLHNLLPAT
jgi:hypothetical protein